MAGTEWTLEFDFRNKRYKDAEKGFRAFANHFGTPEAIERATPVLKRELKEFLDQVAEALIRRHSSAWPGGTTGKTLSKRSGKLTSSIRDSIKIAGTALHNVEGHIGVKGIPYGRIHEFGGVIKPKKAKYLTVPLPSALNSNGTPKRAKARDWDRTFVATSKAGNLLIFRKEAGKIVPLYVLKKSVKIPPRLGLRKTLEAGLPYFVDKAMNQMVKEVLHG